MKREFEVKKVNSILSNLIENSSLKGGLNNIKIQTIWKKTMGDNINSYTSEITLRKSSTLITPLLSQSIHLIFTPHFSLKKCQGTILE